MLQTLGSITYYVIVIFSDPDSDDKFDEKLSEVKNIIVLAQSGLSTLLLTLSIILFPWAAHKKQYAAYQDYKHNFWVQVIGTAALIAINAAIGGLFRSYLRNESSIFYVFMMDAQVLFGFIFVISKRPRDILAWFNKRPDIAFSAFQYPNFTNALRKAKII